MKQFLIYSLLILVLILEIFFSYHSYKDSSRFVNLQKEISQSKGLNTTIEKKFDEMVEKISFGVLDKYSKQESKTSKLSHKAKIEYKNSINEAYYFFGTISLFLIMFYLIDIDIFIIFVSFSSIISLTFALISPLLTVVVYKNMPIIGDVIFSFKSKTILGTIHQMFSDNNYLVAFLVLLFSVVIPFFKSIILLVYGFLKEYHRGKMMVDFVHKIGKWSMADVFIVSMLLVFFSTKQDIQTLLKLQIGTYFFISYVLLSMFVSSFIAKRV